MFISSLRYTRYAPCDCSSLFITVDYHATEARHSGYGKKKGNKESGQRQKEWRHRMIDWGKAQSETFVGRSSRVWTMIASPLRKRPQMWNMTLTLHSSCRVWTNFVPDSPLEWNLRVQPTHMPSINISPTPESFREVKNCHSTPCKEP